MIKQTFCISILIEECMTVDEIWPDGNAPQNPTEEDVRKAFMSCGRNVFQTAEDWGMTQGAELDVRKLRIPK